MKMFKMPLEGISSSPRFKPFMKKLALIGLVETVAGLLMHFLKIAGGSVLLILGMGTLAIFAFSLGQLFPYPASEEEVVPNGLRPIWKFAMTLSGWSLSILLMGLLFGIMHWPGVETLLYVGLLSLAVSAIVWIYFIKKKNNNQ